MGWYRASCCCAFWRNFIFNTTPSSSYPLPPSLSPRALQVCGASHRDTAQCCSTLATVLYHMGDISAAVLGAEEADQDALVNRALVVKGECESRSE